MTVRIDLHVHSSYSARPSQWILQKIGCPESFTEPSSLYMIAKQRGMTHVTITDHNGISGALEIAHLPDAFISEEITTYFPEDHCKVHILALNITESEHRDIQLIRENIYDLADFLLQNDICHIVAHPLFSVNGRLTIAHFEKMLLLFKNFELNGARNDMSNDTLKRVLGGLSPADIDRLADRHNISPKTARPWKKNLIGGSDDHSSLNIARTFTEIPEADTIDGALKGISENRADVIRRPSTPLTFAHNIYGIAYQYYYNKLELERYAGSDTLLDFLDRCLQPDRPKSHQGLMSKLYCRWYYRKRPRLQSQIPETLGALIRHESGRLLYDNPQLLEIAESGIVDGMDLENKWFEFVNLTANRMVVSLAQNLMSQVSGANVFNMFQTIGEAGGLYAMLAPYLISFSFFSQDRVFSEKVIRHFKLRGDADEATKFENKNRVVAHFTDQLPTRWAPSFNALIGSPGDLEHPTEMVTALACGHHPEETLSQVRIFKPVGTFENAGLTDHQLLFPPFMEMLGHCYSEHVTHIHSASPGPVGIAALGVSRILKVPVYGTFHPSLRAYFPLTDEDEAAADILEPFMSWYYGQLDRIYVFSKESLEKLRQSGVDEQKLIHVPLNIDLQLFRPAGQNRLTGWRRSPGSITLLFSGPVTQKNNLWLLAEVYKVLQSQYPTCHLTVVGDGPYLTGLEKILEGFPFRFHRRLTDAARARVYRNSTIFVWTGDDSGNGQHLLEAQACGLPSVVTDRDGQARLISAAGTGLVYKHNNATSLYEALLKLISEPVERKRMAEAARRYAESLSIDISAFCPFAPELTISSSDAEIQLAAAV